jgi:hypothetical protein
MLLQVFKHFIYLFADDVLEAEGNFHQPFHMILMIMGNGRVTFQAEAVMPSAHNPILLSHVRTPHHDNLYITIYKPFWTKRVASASNYILITSGSYPFVFR